MLLYPCDGGDRGKLNDLRDTFDVLVVGGGNAGLCAAITARRAGARVLVLESAIKDFRGGNSRHTRDIRYMHKAATAYVTGPYGEQEFWEDLWQVTGGETNERLARLTIQDSEELGDWMPANGVRWQKPLRGTLHLAKSNLFMLGRRQGHDERLLRDRHPAWDRNRLRIGGFTNC